MSDEEEKIRAEILASQEKGTLTDSLVDLITGLAMRRTGYHLAQDIAQDVLLSLMCKINTIDPAKGDPHNFVCMCVVNSWRRKCRHRKYERRYLIRTMLDMLDALPSNARAAARGKSLGSFHRISKLKYY